MELAFCIHCNTRKTFLVTKITKDGVTIEKEGGLVFIPSHLFKAQFKMIDNKTLKSEKIKCYKKPGSWRKERGSLKQILQPIVDGFIDDNDCLWLNTLEVKPIVQIRATTGCILLKDLRTSASQYFTSFKTVKIFIKNHDAVNNLLDEWLNRINSKRPDGRKFLK